MYTNLYSMILNLISLQNYFENFSKFKKFPIMYPVSGLTVDRAGRPVHSRPDRSTEPVTEPCGQGVHVCARLSVDRPVDRLEALCSLFFVGRPGQSTDSTKWNFSLAAGRPTGRPSPTASLPIGLSVDRGGRPTTACSPQRLLFWFLVSWFDWDLCVSYIWKFEGYFLT